MEFSEKLQKLRKEHNITQEGLADKLNVSRQAVSKWESGLAYPDTEKLIQLSKIFKISLDELINDDISDVSKKTETISIKDGIHKCLEFISKTVNMFWSMKFFDKIKCIIEMIVLFLMLWLLAYMSVSIVGNLLLKIFGFIPYNILYPMSNIFEALFYAIWLVVGGIIFIRVFKTRYLDYYVVITDDTINEKKIEKPIPELKEKKEVKVVIRDPEHSNFNLFKKLLNLFMICLRIMCFIFIIPTIILFVCLIALFIISLFYMTFGLLFNGISIALIGASLFTYLIIEFFYNIIFNRSHKVNRLFILFVISISMVGIGCGLSAYDMMNFSITTVDNYNEDSKIIKMDDDLVFFELIHMNEDDIIIDNSIDYIKVDVATLDGVELYTYEYDEYSCINEDDECNCDNYYDYDDSCECNYTGNCNEFYQYKTLRFTTNYSEFDYFKKMFDGLKDKKIVNVDDTWRIDKIYISEDNLTKLRENYLKYRETV